MSVALEVGRMSTVFESGATIRLFPQASIREACPPQLHCPWKKSSLSFSTSDIPGFLESYPLATASCSQGRQFIHGLRTQAVAPRGLEAPESDLQQTPQPEAT